ncbi:MAG: hypothetical protein N3I35_08230 [Clostridia bacterium]|nr:hypothetical protein [Clostridia bacterium]
MTHEQKLELIKSYIDDIENYIKNQNLSINEKQHMERAYGVYMELYRDAERGKVDPDIIHENITGFFYMLQ